MSEASERHWAIGTLEGFHANTIYDRNGETYINKNPICHVYGIPHNYDVGEFDERYSEGIANAALIVRAVNSHAELVAACEAAIGPIEFWVPKHEALDQLRTALQNAKKG